MANQPQSAVEIIEDISVEEIDLALQKLLENRVTIDTPSGTKKIVPIYFQDRDTKKMADMTDTRGSIHVLWQSTVRADDRYRIQEDQYVVASEDENGNPIDYRVRRPPEPVWVNYLIVARSSKLYDIRKIQGWLDRFFPVTHTTLEVKGYRTHVYRDGFSAADVEDAGIFQRQLNIRILGFIAPLDSADGQAKIVPAIRSMEVEIGNTLDPDAPDEIFERIVV